MIWLTYSATANVDAILVDEEFVFALDEYRQTHPNVPFIIDKDDSKGDGQYDQAVLEGLEYDKHSGNHGWDGLEVQVGDEESLIALSYTSGTTARPKGVEYTHRGAYLAALANVVESGLNVERWRAITSGRFPCSMPWAGLFRGLSPLLGELTTA